MGKPLPTGPGLGEQRKGQLYSTGIYLALDSEVRDMDPKKKYSLFICNSNLNGHPVFLLAKSGNSGVGVSATSGTMVLGVGADLVLWLPNFVLRHEPGTCHVCSPINDQHITCFYLILSINNC